MAKALISVLLFSLALAGCASDYNPSRPYSSDEVRQLALEDLARRSLSFEEYQAKRQAILEENRKPPSASPTPPYAVPPSEAFSNGQEKAPRCGASSYSGVDGQPQDRRLITSVSSTSMFSRRGL